MRKILEYRVPLDARGGEVAHLFLPHDLTAAEAERLCAMIRTLVIPDRSPGEPNGEEHDG